MNDELQEKLVKWLGKTEDAVEQAIDFSAEQIPDVINQLVTYNLAMSAAGVGIGVLVLLAAPACWYASRNLTGEDKFSLDSLGLQFPWRLDLLLLDVTFRLY